MSTIHFHQTTTLTPEQYIEGLTDFSPGRSKVFSKSADDYLKVHSVGPTEADVTEGSGGVWERLHYDWSNPSHVVLTTTDSNTWGGSSGYTYTFNQLPDGTTDVDVVIVREGKNAKGHVLALVLGTVGKGVLAKAFGNSIKSIEARDTSRLLDDCGPVTTARTSRSARMARSFAGVVTSAVGTLAMDASLYRRYRDNETRRELL